MPTIQLGIFFVIFSVAVTFIQAGDSSPAVEATGMRTLKSAHGTYLRATGCDDVVPRSPGQVDLSRFREKCEQWFIQKSDGTVALRPVYAPGRFLRANFDRSIDLADWRRDNEMWTPVKNDNGSFSFQSVQGNWLSADEKGAVYNEPEHSSFEVLWLEDVIE